jgi:prepilin-type N-terminal cleavage/methylation domain-containing protein
MRSTAVCEQGFTMVEVTVAISLFAVVSVFMAGVMAGGLRGVLLGKQRAAATADANQVLETARSLSYADLGLASDDPTLDTDTSITTITDTNRTYNAEPVIFAQSTANHPFNPHTQSVTRSPTSLTRSVYVTGVDTNGDGAYDVKRVTVRVSWDRSPIGGVANSVTAATLIASKSPGTPGNPPLGTPGPTATPPPYPPLRSTTTSRGPSAVMEADIGSDASVEGSSRPLSTLRLNPVNGHGSNILDASSAVTCAQQYAQLQGSLDATTTSTSGDSVANSADSTTAQGPYTSTKTQNEVTTGVVPAPFAITSGSLQGVVSCTSSGVTSPTQLPYESGTGALAGLTATVNTGAAPLTASFGTIGVIELTSAVSGQSATQTNTSNKTMTSSSIHGLADMKLMRQTGLASGIIDIGAPEGLVHVTGYQATAASSSNATGGSTAVSMDPAKPLTVRIWDGGLPNNLTDQNGNPVVCDSYSGSYCELRPSVGAQRIVQMDQHFCVGLVPLVCLEDLHVEMTVTISPATSQTTTLPDGITKVYRTDYAPVTAVARMRATNNGDSSTKFDVRTTADLGRIIACAKFGVLPGGC